MNPVTEGVLRHEIAHIEEALVNHQQRRTNLLQSLGRESLEIARCEEALSALQADLFGHGGRHFSPVSGPEGVLKVPVDGTTVPRTILRDHLGS